MTRTILEVGKKYTLGGSGDSTGIYVGVNNNTAMGEKANEFTDLQKGSHWLLAEKLGELLGIAPTILPNGNYVAQYVTDEELDNGEVHDFQLVEEGPTPRC